MNRLGWLIFLCSGMLTSHSCKSDLGNGILLELTSGKDNINYPVSWVIEIDNSQWSDTEDVTIELVEDSKDGRDEIKIPGQLKKLVEKNKYELTAIVPKSSLNQRIFRVEFRENKDEKNLQVKIDDNGQYILIQDDLPILQYNYETVYEEDVVRPEGEVVKMVYDKMSGPYYEAFLESHPNYPSDTVVTSSIYSVPRSNYIHPLYGLDEELLTRDWPDGGHPHHRGIFWAWPEVIYGDQMGDIYALQRVFARPTGQIELLEGPVYAQIEAENVWMWDEKLPIVREKAEIRAYRAGENERIIDLSLELLALEEDITIATRFTNSYGGLNVRMETPDEQDISYHVDESDKDFRKAWADFNGTFKGRDHKSGLLILQHRSNPEYPGEWVEYPELSWIQPTFPSPGTRYPLNSTKPLKLKYRFVVHLGGEPSNQVSESYWDAYHYSDIE